MSRRGAGCLYLARDSASRKQSRGKRCPLPAESRPIPRTIHAVAIVEPEDLASSFSIPVYASGGAFARGFAMIWCSWPRIHRANGSISTVRPDRYLLDAPLDLVVLGHCHAFFQKPHRPYVPRLRQSHSWPRNRSSFGEFPIAGGFTDQREIGLHLGGGYRP